MKNKNILIVSPYFYPEGGGLELYTFKIADHLAKKNNVTVICATKKETKTEDMGFRVIRKHPDFFISNTPINLNLKKEIELIAEQQKIELITAHTPVPFYADMSAEIAKKLNIPFVLHYHSSSLYKGSTLIDAIAFVYEKLFEKKIFKIAKKIIPDSYYLPLEKKLAEYKYKISVVPSFVDLNEFRVSTLKKKEILFVGQLNKAHRWKGLDNLLKAFSIFCRKNPEYKLIVVGDGDYRAHYEKTAKKINIKNKVNFVGKLSREQIKFFYQTCSFVVVPSISNVEGTPTVLFEAMASGKPIVAGRAGGIPYIIEKEKCGMITDAKKINDLAEKMDRLANDENLYKKFSANCLKNVMKYDSATKIKKIEKIYES
jgi:glycosyltransferase involved in cell wall biosynthesis